jgi:hypothetical protein
MDTSGSTAAPTAFYSNKMLSTPLSPPGKNNGSGPSNSNDSNNSRHRNSNRCNGGSGSKNIDNGGNCCGNTSSNTTVVSHGATTNDGRGPSPWPTSVNPSQGHIAMYHGPPDNNGRRISWPRQGLTPYRALSPGRSSCTSRPLLRLLRAGHPGTAWARTSSRS